VKLAVSSTSTNDVSLQRELVKEHTCPSCPTKAVNLLTACQQWREVILFCLKTNYQTMGWWSGWKLVQFHGECPLRLFVDVRVRLDTSTDTVSIENRLAFRCWLSRVSLKVVDKLYVIMLLNTGYFGLRLFSKQNSTKYEKVNIVKLCQRASDPTSR